MKGREEKERKARQDRTGDASQGEGPRFNTQDYRDKQANPQGVRYVQNDLSFKACV